MKHLSQKSTKMACLFIVLLLVFSSCILLSNTTIAKAENKQINYFGTVVPCGKDNGYKPNTTSSWNPWTLLTTPGTILGLIPDGDPHKGWSLGSFFVDGFSGKTDSNLNTYQKTMPVYLKNAGDTINFGFKLDQDINKLNGNSSLTIADDKQMVQNCWVEDPYITGDFHHGVLIIVHTDYQGKQKISTYRDFLVGKSVGANTSVQLFEEGDYRVILCYEIYKNTGWNWLTNWMDPNSNWFDYRIESYFSVRNGNAMFYPFELTSGSELTNKKYTDSGFRIDLAKSRYLKLTAKKENLNSSGSEIIEDIRFNKVIADGTEFTDEGRYTITVINQYTGLSTEKIIYVGANNIMRCNAVTGLDVSTINTRLSQGYTIKSNGTLAAPIKVDSTLISNISSNVVNEPTNISVPSSGLDAITIIMIIVGIIYVLFIFFGAIMGLVDFIRDRFY